MSGWFSGGGLQEYAAETAVSTAKVFVFDGICALAASGYGYMCLSYGDVVHYTWKGFFGLIGAAQAGAVPVFRTLRVLSYVSEYAKTTIRYMYRASYFASIFVIAFLVGIISEVNQWLEDTEKLMNYAKESTLECKGNLQDTFLAMKFSKEEEESLRKFCGSVDTWKASADSYNTLVGLLMFFSVLHLSVAYLAYGFALEYEPEKTSEDDYGDYYDDTD